MGASTDGRKGPSSARERVLARGALWVLAEVDGDVMLRSATFREYAWVVVVLGLFFAGLMASIAPNDDGWLEPIVAGMLGLLTIAGFVAVIVTGQPGPRPIVIRGRDGSVWFDAEEIEIPREQIVAVVVRFCRTGRKSVALGVLADGQPAAEWTVHTVVIDRAQLVAKSTVADEGNMLARVIGKSTATDEGDKLAGAIAAALGALPVVCVADDGLCIRCSYDLHGCADSPKCPECGEPISSWQAKNAVVHKVVPTIGRNKQR